MSRQANQPAFTPCPSHALVQAIHATEDLESGGEGIPTIELSSSAEVCDVESEDGSPNYDGDSQCCADGSRQISLEAPAITVSMSAAISTIGGIPVTQTQAEFTSATIIKPSMGTELGVSFRSLASESAFCISRIKKNGLISMSGAPLNVGDKIISINNKSCDRMDHKFAAKLLREASGFVTIVAQNSGGDPCNIETMITKPSPNHRSGIGFSSSGSPPGINVCSIFPDGLFAASLLTIGDEVLSINGIPCRELDPAAAADIIKSAPKYVTIIARKFEGNGVVVASSDSGTRNTHCWTKRTIGILCQLLFGLAFVAALITLVLYLKFN